MTESRTSVEAAPTAPNGGISKTNATSASIDAAPYV
jgi:hypothetical protein